MPLGPRKRSPDMRNTQGKIVNPKNVHKGVKTTSGKEAPSKQDTQTGPKYTGPHYPQRGKGVAGKVKIII